MNNLSPLVLFVYNRPEHTKEVLKSLAACKCASDSKIFIFSDASKNNGNDKKVKEVRRIIKLKEWEDSFSEVNIIEAKENKGLAKSVISGVSEVINKYGKVIVIEDDNRVAYDFIEFMNNGLDFYETNPKIGYIGGYTLPINIPDDYDKDVFLTGRGSSYAWATWKDRWDLVDWEVKDFETFRKDKKAIESFNEYGEDRFRMLEKQVNGQMNSWAIRFSYALWKNKKYAILPRKTRVENIGFDGSGVHNVAQDNKFKVSIEKNLEPVVFENVEEDIRIKKEFQRIFRIPLSLKIRRKLKNLISGGKKD